MRDLNSRVGFSEIVDFVVGFWGVLVQGAKTLQRALDTGNADTAQLETMPIQFVLKRDQLETMPIHLWDHGVEFLKKARLCIRNDSRDPSYPAPPS